MSKTSLVPRLLIALLLAVPSTVVAQDSCQEARTAAVLDGDQPLVFFLGGRSEAGVSLHFVLRGDGAHGAGRATDGTSTTIMITEGPLPVLECNDVNLDGFAGLTQVVLTMRDVRSASGVAVRIVPLDGEIDSGHEQVTVVVDGRTFVDALTVIGAGGAGGAINPRLASRFAVTANGGQFDLGTWSKVSGLDATFDVVDYRAGGGTITLHRTASSDCALVKAWLEAVAQSFVPTTITISQLDQSNEPIATWTFTGVFPTNWQVAGPEATTSTPGTESLVLAYQSVDVILRPGSLAYQ